MSLVFNPFTGTFDFVGTTSSGGSGTVTNIATTAPITGGPITTTGTIGITDAAADGTTKGAAAFTAADFNASSGVIALDYTNGQKASASLPGFLSSADWTTFNNKGSGSVTSVALTVPSILSVSGSPITGAGTLAVTLQTEAANLVFAGPTTGSAATPTFRSLVAADLPAPVVGTDTQVIFNDGGTLAGNAALRFDKTETIYGLKVGTGVPVAADAPIDLVLAAANESNWQFALLNTTYSTNPNNGLFGGITNAGEIDLFWSNYVGALALGIDGSFNLTGAVSIQKTFTGTADSAGILSTTTFNNASLTAGELVAVRGVATHPAAVLTGVNITFDLNGTETYPEVVSFPSQVNINGTTTATSLFGTYIQYAKAAGATVGNVVAQWNSDLSGLAATNAYYYWADSQGVYRIREDTVADTASFPQAVVALYNPRFTKYVAGATNFERIVQQWVGNVATVTTEAGGTGTLRNLRLNGAALQLGADTILETGKALKTDTTTAHTALFQAYDVDGTAYKTFATLTNGNTPDFTITPPSGGTVTLNATTLQQGGNAISLASTLTTSGAFALTLTQTASTNVTLPTTGTLATLAGTETLTNKWVKARTDTVASSATPSINTDTTDIFTITALAAAISTMSTNLTGAPVNGQRLIIRILDNGTARALAWGASFAARGVALPTTTVISKYLYVGFLWNSTTTTWDCVAAVTEA